MAKVRLTRLQQISYDAIAKGYGYIECDPRGYKSHKARQINALIKKGLIEAWDSGGHTHKMVILVNCLTVLMIGGSVLLV